MATIGMPPQQPLQIVVDTQPRARGPRWLHIILALAVLIAFYSLWNWFSRSLRHTRRRTLCMKHTEPISVLFHCFRDAEQCAFSILSLLRGASCPNRVHIAVYQELDAGDTDVHSSALRMARGDEEVEWVHRLRIVSTDDATTTSMGSLFAWRELLRGPAKSKFVLVTRPGVQAMLGWDISLVETWRNARVDRLREIPVITAALPGGHRERAPSNHSSGALGVAQDWINAATANNRQKLHQSQKSVFTTIKEFRGRFPELSIRTFPRVPKHPVSTLAASGSMVFGPRIAFARAMRAYPCDEPVADYAVDWVLSAMLWSSGTRFLAPPVCPFSLTHNRDMRPKRWDSRTVGKAITRDHAAYATFAGVDLEKAVTSGRGRMGLLPDLKSEDILSKYGSRATFDRIRRGFQ